jgi:hypothetical protein
MSPPCIRRQQNGLYDFYTTPRSKVPDSTAPAAFEPHTPTLYFLVRRSKCAKNPAWDAPHLIAIAKVARAPAQRLTRLKHHFSCDAKFILIGEAPDCQGAKLSGILFTS